MMHLINVYEHPDAIRILYELLGERQTWQNISHKEMPSLEQHTSFVVSRPYADWCLIEDVVGNEGTVIVGAIYLTKADEIGIHIFKRWARQGFGHHSVRCMMAKHGARRYLANCAPGNASSIEMFQGLGFKLIQKTYELVA